ncbi:MAG: DUF4254 domain-containing protein [Myxococcales bacterium]|nr:DUF4254 domain-containing protein [Myxococcales bacterium]
MPISPVDFSPPPSAQAWWEALQRGPSAPLLRALHVENTALWDLEDAARAATSSDALAGLKRSIDATNLARHAAVAALDQAVDAWYRPTAGLDTPGVVVNSESVGQLLDRLSILALKQAAWASRPERLAALGQRVQLLLFCLQRSLDALAAGRALPQRFDEAKRYGPASPG